MIYKKKKKRNETNFLTLKKKKRKAEYLMWESDEGTEVRLTVG